MTFDYKPIIRHYEDCLDRHGDSHLGVDWPKLDDTLKRYKVMIEVERYAQTDPSKFSLLDFGCGAGHLLEYLRQNHIDRFEYHGCDISEKFISLCKSKFNDIDFRCYDAIAEPQQMSEFDFVVMNGVLTEKRELTFEQMWQYTQTLLSTIFQKTRVGLAFNVMSKQVQWERDDLFHLPFDLLAGFLSTKLTRNYVFRNDYGLYEYTVYVYK